MNNDFITKLLEQKHPKLLEKKRSKQKEKSIELLNIRLDNKISVENFSRLLKMSVENYLNYEFGSIEYTVLDYENLINKAKRYLKYHIIR